MTTRIDLAELLRSRPEVERPWATVAEERADLLLNGRRLYSDEVRAVAMLFDLLDALTGDLLAVECVEEFSLAAGCENAYAFDMCLGCKGERHRHEPGCRIDARLTELGYPDQASRDAERARREKR